MYNNYSKLSMKFTSYHNVIIKNYIFNYNYRQLTMKKTNINLEKDLLFYRNKKQTPVSLKALMETAKGELLSSRNLWNNNHLSDDITILIQIACFLHRELPVRIAHRIDHLQSSPYFLKSANMQVVNSWYRSSFERLRECPIPDTKEKLKNYTSLLSNLYDRHSSTLISIAKGVHEIRNYLAKDKDSFADETQIQKRIDEFYLSRIGIRMLVAQFLELQKPPMNPNMIGLINMKCSPYQIAHQAIYDTTYMCKRTYGDAPEVIILGRTDLHFPYVESHLNYMLLEILKNSMRATVVTHGIDHHMPPIKIVIADGEDNEDVVIKISDEGGGIPRSNMNRIWSYLYTTADPSILEQMVLDDSSEGNNSSNNVKDFTTSSPLAGLGYGLPVARNYARYFGGDIKLMSMECYGTDGYIYLPRLGNIDASTTCL